MFSCFVFKTEHCHRFTSTINDINMYISSAVNNTKIRRIIFNIISKQIVVLPYALTSLFNIINNISKCL